MFTQPFFKIHLNIALPKKFRSPNWRVTIL